MLCRIQCTTIGRSSADCQLGFDITYLRFLLSDKRLRYGILFFFVPKIATCCQASNKRGRIRNLWAHIAFLFKICQRRIGFTIRLLVELQVHCEPPSHSCAIATAISAPSSKLILNVQTDDRMIQPKPLWGFIASYVFRKIDKLIEMDCSTFILNVELSLSSKFIQAVGSQRRSHVSIVLFMTSYDIIITLRTEHDLNAGGHITFFYICFSWHFQSTHSRLRPLCSCSVDRHSFTQCKRVHLSTSICSSSTIRICGIFFVCFSTIQHWHVESISCMRRHADERVESRRIQLRERVTITMMYGSA